MSDYVSPFLIPYFKHLVVVFCSKTKAKQLCCINVGRFGKNKTEYIPYSVKINCIQFGMSLCTLVWK